MLLQIVKDYLTSQDIVGITLESGWQVTSPYLSGDDCSSTDSIDYEEETQEFGIWFKLLLLDYITINVITKQMEWGMSPKTRDLLKSADHSPHTTLSYNAGELYNISIEELFDTASELVDQIQQVQGQRSPELHKSIVSLLYNHVLPQIKLTREDKSKLEYHLQKQTQNLKKLDAEIEAWNSTAQALKHTIQNLTKKVVGDLQEYPMLKAARPELKDLCVEELKRQLHLIDPKATALPGRKIEKRASLDPLSTEEQKEAYQLTRTIAELMKKPKGASNKWVKKYDWFLTDRENVYSSLQLSCNELKQCRKFASRLTQHKIRAINVKESLYTTITDLSTDDVSYGFDVQSPAGRSTESVDISRSFQSLGDRVKMITMDVHSEAGRNHVYTCNWIIEECAATALVWKENKELVPTQDGHQPNFPKFDPMLDGLIEDGFIVITGPDVITDIINKISTQCAFMTGAFFKHIPRLDKTYGNTTKLILAYECILYRRIYQYIYNVLELRYDGVVSQLSSHLSKLDWSDFDLDDPWIPQLLLKQSEPVKPSDSVIKRWLSAASQDSNTSEDLELDYQNVSVIERTPSPVSQLPAYQHKEKFPSFKQERSSEHSVTHIYSSAPDEQSLDLSHPTQENNIDHLENDYLPTPSMKPVNMTLVQYGDDSTSVTVPPKPLPRRLETRKADSESRLTMISNPSTVVKANNTGDEEKAQGTSKPIESSTELQHSNLPNGQLPHCSKSIQHDKNSNPIRDGPIELEELDICLDEALDVLDQNETGLDSSLPATLKALIDNPEVNEVKNTKETAVDSQLPINGEATLVSNTHTNGATVRPNTLTVPGESRQLSADSLRVKFRSRSVGARKSNRKVRAVDGELPERHTYSDVELDNVKHADSPISPKKLLLASETKEQVDKIISNRRSRSYRRSKSYVPIKPSTSSKQRPRTEPLTNHRPPSAVPTNQSEPIEPAEDEASETVDSTVSDDTVKMRKRFLELFDESVQVLNSVKDVYSPLEKSQTLAKCLRTLSSQLSNLTQNMKFQTSCSSDDLITVVIILLLSIDKSLFRSIYLQLKFISKFMDVFMDIGVHHFSLIQFIAAVQYIQDSVVTKIHSRHPVQSSC